MLLGQEGTQLLTDRHLELGRLSVHYPCCAVLQGSVIPSLLLVHVTNQGWLRWGWWLLSWRGWQERVTGVVWARSHHHQQYH